jgi:RNA 2',3'-cyclic 3'-phosphodiesterase
VPVTEDAQTGQNGHMRLFAAIVPPQAVLEEVRDAVAGVRTSTGPVKEPKRGLFGRRSGGRADVAEVAPDEELVIPTLREMYLPVTHFGNVTQGDSVQLARALRTEARTWERPTVRFSGGTALEFKGDESVWAKLEGDLDELMTIGRGVPQVVQRLGFFVDRRQFRPWLSVGTITDKTTPPYLEALVAALDGLSSNKWTVETVSLMKRLPDEGPHAFEVMEELPLAEG